MAQQDDDKQLDPTQKKLDDARKKGDIAKSQEVNTAAAYAGLVLGFGLSGTYVAQGVLDANAFLIAAPDLLLQASEDTVARLRALLLATAQATFPIFAAPALAVLLALIAQRAIVFAPDKLQLKLNRISILENAKNKYGRSGLFEFSKSFVKLTVITVVLGYFAVAKVEPVVMASLMETGQVLALAIDLCGAFLLIVLLLAVIIGVIDFVWQRFELLRRNRMSHKDMKDEAKEAEGDPMMKQQRRQRAMDIATNRMLSDVPEASVIVVNPTHYAVALKWNPTMPGAPVCVAKGVDEVAARIREIAESEGIPIHSDPPTARALHASVEIGAEIDPELYKPVAAAIRFADEMRRRARAQGWRRP